MKPRTKIQREVFELSESLPRLTPKQEYWAFEHCMPHVGYRTNKGIDCLDCGHWWKGDKQASSDQCPCCGTMLKVESTRKKRMYPGKKYMAILDIKDGYQIVRVFQMWADYRAGRKCDFTIWEVVQQFHAEDGKVHIVSRYKPFSYYNDAWAGYLENRSNTAWESKYDLWIDKIYPEMAVRPEYQKHGFTDVKDLECSPYQVWKAAAHDHKAETLLKAKNFNWLGWYIGRQQNRIYRYWDTLKICFRNDYIVPSDEVITYLDYLDLLHHFNKDLHSPKYVCPADLKHEHNKLVEKKRQIDHRLQMQQQREQLIKDQEKLQKDAQAYLELKGAYIGMAFSTGNIHIRVLESVDDFLRESDIHRHCVFTNKYYRVKDSLCLAASVDGQPMETIEVSLKNFTILQSRGAHNNFSKYHDEIVAAMQKHLHKIKKRFKEVNKSQVAA